MMPDIAKDTGGEAGRALAASHRMVALRCAAFALFMLGAAFAAVPLYDMFCRVTGFGGTVQRVAAPSAAVLERTVRVRFDSNVSPGLPWTFAPVERTVTVRYGENALAFYRATNTSDVPVTGTAAFNVAPEIAGAYFAKVECFCFKEQTLEPGQSIEMPVSFYVDPAMVENRQAEKVREITLSYTFYAVDKPKAAAQKQAGVSVGTEQR